MGCGRSKQHKDVQPVGKCPVSASGGRNKREKVVWARGAQQNPHRGEEQERVKCNATAGVIVRRAFESEFFVE